MDNPLKRPMRNTKNVNSLNIHLDKTVRLLKQYGQHEYFKFLCFKCQKSMQE